MWSRLRIIIGVGIVCFSMLQSTPAWALLLGNPGHSFKGGEFGVGLGLGDNREEVTFNIGIKSAGVIDLFLAFEDTALLVERDEVGIGYRHNLGKGFTLAGLKIQLGALGQYRQGTLKSFGQESDYSLIDLGVGGYFTPITDLNIYAAGIYERFQFEAAVGGVKASQSDTNLGLMVGVDYQFSNSFLGGAEIHPRLEDKELIIYVLFRFGGASESSKGASAK